MENEKEGMLLGQVCCAKAGPRLCQGWKPRHKRNMKYENE